MNRRIGRQGTFFKGFRRKEVLTMPGFDGKGPEGLGPMTGGGFASLLSPLPL